MPRVQIRVRIAIVQLSNTRVTMTALRGTGTKSDVMRQSAPKQTSYLRKEPDLQHSSEGTAGSLMRR